VNKPSRSVNGNQTKRPPIWPMYIFGWLFVFWLLSVAPHHRLPRRVWVHAGIMSTIVAAILVGGFALEAQPPPASSITTIPGYFGSSSPASAISTATLAPTPTPTSPSVERAETQLCGKYGGTLTDQPSADGTADCQIKLDGGAWWINFDSKGVPMMDPCLDDYWTSKYNVQWSADNCGAPPESTNQAATDCTSQQYYPAEDSGETFTDQKWYADIDVCTAQVGF